MIRVSIPINMFDNSLKEIKKLQRKMYIYRQEYKDPSTLNYRKSSLKILISKTYANYKSEKDKITAYWDYVQLRSLNPEIGIFDNKEFIKKASEFLKLTPKEIRKKKRRIIKFKFARISGQKFIFSSKDNVWESYGLNISKRKYKDGKRLAHKKLGVYKVVGVKKKTITIKYKEKNTEIYKTKKIVKIYEKKKEVKILKINVSESQVRSKRDLKEAVALAIYKHTIDREVSRRQHELRKIEDASFVVDLSCAYVASSVGYLSSGSGWSMRNNLTDCGFIDIKKNRRVVQSNLTYEKAKDNFPLQKGIQEDGWAYYYNKSEMTVYAVKCYSVSINGYEPIIYPHNRKKRDTSNFIPWYEKELQKLDGKPIKKIWAEYEHLFSGKTSDFLFELLDSNSVFYYNDWLQRNSKKPSGNQTKQCL